MEKCVVKSVGTLPRHELLLQVTFTSHPTSLFMRHPNTFTHSQDLTTPYIIFPGAEEPEAVRKLMSLSEKVKPHNSKLHPLPGHHIAVPSLHPSPGVTRRPVSPGRVAGAHRPMAAVHLTAESSSVSSLGNRTALRKSQTPSTSGRARYFHNYYCKRRYFHHYYCKHRYFRAAKFLRIKPHEAYSRGLIFAHIPFNSICSLMIMIFTYIELSHI